MRRPRPLLLLLLAACDPAPAPAVEEPEVPTGARCEPVADAPLVAAEQALLAEINALRAGGGRCGTLAFLPAAPLRFAPALRCAARLHSEDMVAREFLGVLDPDGLGTGARLLAVDYEASTFGENVGFSRVDADDPDLAEVAAADIAAAWADNPTTCWKLRARELEQLGIGATLGSYTQKGAEPTPGVIWTATFAAP